MSADFVWCGTCPPGVGRTLLCWSKRVWRCRHRACPTVTFSELTVAYPARRWLVAAGWTTAPELVCPEH